MKLYLLSQSVNNDYDTYDSCVVCAEDEDSAKRIRPDSYSWEEECNGYSWVTKVEDVKVRYLGEADAVIKNGVVLSSFNAG
jgi:hypothetical protein